MPLYGQPDVVEDQSQLGRRDDLADRASTRRQSRSVSSMRVPAGARTCSVIWPASTVGKKSAPSNGSSSDADARRRQEDRERTRARRSMTASPAARGSASRSRSNACVEARAARRPNGVAAGGAAPSRRRVRAAGSAPSSGTSVRDRKYDASIANTTAIASGDEQRPRRARRGRTPARRRCRSHSVETNAGTAICCAPSRIACVDRLAHVEVAVDVLDLDRRVVDQDADRQRQPAERHDVDRLPQRAQHDDRAQDRQRDRDARRSACCASCRGRAGSSAPSGRRRSAPRAARRSTRRPHEQRLVEQQRRS